MLLREITTMRVQRWQSHKVLWRNYFSVMTCFKLTCSTQHLPNTNPAASRRQGSNTLFSQHENKNFEISFSFVSLWSPLKPESQFWIFPTIPVWKAGASSGDKKPGKLKNHLQLKQHTLCSFPAWCVQMAFAHQLQPEALCHQNQRSQDGPICFRCVVGFFSFLKDSCGEDQYSNLDLWPPLSNCSILSEMSRKIYFWQFWIISYQWGTDLRLLWLDLNFWSPTANYIPGREWVFVLYLIFCLAVMWDVIFNRVGWLAWGPKRLPPLGMAAACTEPKWGHWKGHYHQIPPP